MKVTEIMSRPVISVTPDTTIKEAVQLLVEHGFSALPVLDAIGDLVGIVSEADLLPVESQRDPRSQSTHLPPTAGLAPRTVAEIMTREVRVVSVATEISQAARIVLDSDIKSVPVLEGTRVIGIVSRGDLVGVIARRDYEIMADVFRLLI